MSLINKEKVLNGVGKAVDVTNKAQIRLLHLSKKRKLTRKL